MKSYVAKIRRGLWCSLLLLQPGLNCVAWALEFDEIPALVRERNQHTQGAMRLREAAVLAQGQLTRSFLPRVHGAVGQETFKTGSQKRESQPYGSIGASVNLYNGGRDLNAERITGAAAGTAAVQSEQTYREEVKKARQLYWQLVSQREVAALIQNAVDQNATNLNAAKNRIRAGLATETDRLDFEMHQIELEQDLARLRLAARNTERSLGVLLGLPEDSAVPTSVAVGHAHQDELLKDTVNPATPPALNILRLQAERARDESALAGRWWQPRLDAYARYGLYTFPERSFTEQDERIETVYGVQLSVELFDGGTARNLARVKALEAEGMKLSYEQTAREIGAQIEGSKAELRLTHELVHKSEEAIARSKSYLRRTLDEYRRGVKNSPDVLSASERSLEMHRRFAELRRDYQLARAEILAVTGN